MMFQACARSATLRGMDLILWRHAQAQASHPDGDFWRALTVHGERQAQQMGLWLAARLPEDARVVVSPARRAQQTAAALGRPVESVAEVGLDASADTLLKAAGWPEYRGTVVVVGHQPTLGEAAARVLAGTPRPGTFEIGAVWWLRSGIVGATLVAVQLPDRAC
jgi:phosphohistidine phosphatase